MNDAWGTPQAVDDVLIAFPAKIEHLLPEKDLCETELAALSDGGARWLQFQTDWFSRGLPAQMRVTPRAGVGVETAFRHLAAIQRSYQLPHEHKVAAVAYLASRWFEDSPTAT